MSALSAASFRGHLTIAWGFGAFMVIGSHAQVKCGSSNNLDCDQCMQIRQVIQVPTGKAT